MQFTQAKLKRTQRSRTAIHPLLYSASDSSEFITPSKKNIRLHKQLTNFKEKYSVLNQKIDLDFSNDDLFFSLIKWRKQKIDSIKHDPQIVSAKLKQLQNLAELGRANMELDQRQLSRKKQLTNESYQVTPTSKKFNRISNYHKRNLNYLQQYNQMLRKKVVEDSLKNEDTQQQIQQITPLSVVCNGVTHYQQLKKRPKVLEFLINRIHSAKVSPQMINPEKNQQKFIIKELKMDYDKVANQTINLNAKNTTSPEKIIEKQYPKFFSRHNDTSLPENIKKNKFCQQVLKYQESIISKTIDLSREGRRKLQQKLNHIVLELSGSARHDPNKFKIKKPQCLSR